jgi:hypothetical protein
MVKVAPAIKKVFLFSAVILLPAAIIWMGWVNHFDFESSIVNDEKRELLIFAKLISHGIDNAALEAKHDPYYIENLLSSINEKDGFTIFVVDNSRKIVIDKSKKYLGKSIADFEKEGKEPKLTAFAKLDGKDGLYGVMVVEKMSALTKPLRRNLRDILILMGLFFSVFALFGYIFYRIRRKESRMEIKRKTLEIINRQLHCAIDDYKCIEKKLSENKW